MELFKNFQIGGLFQSGRRMAAPWGMFRRFTNTFKSPENVFKPYGRGLEVTNAPTVLATSEATGFTHLGPISSQYYRQGILQLHAMRNAGSTKNRGIFTYLGPDGTAVTIMQPFKQDNGKNCVETTKHMLYQPSGNLSSCVVGRKTFLSSMVDTADFSTTKPVNGYTPEESYLLTFDGLRVRAAGLPLPWTSVNPSGVLGAFYARTVYATIGLDGEVVFSQYLQQQLSSATRDVYTSGYTTFSTVIRADCVSSISGSPKVRRPEDHLFERLYSANGLGATGSNLRYFDKRFLKASGAASVSAGELSVTRSTYSLAVDVGDWLMVDVGSPFGTIPATIYMFQVKTLAGTTVFQKNIKYFDQNTSTWTDADFQVIEAAWDAISVDIMIQFEGTMSDITFSNMFSIISYSTSANSGYVVHGILPMAWDSTISYAGRVLSSAKTFTVPWAGVVSSSFTDWYDEVTVKNTFPPVRGITAYRDLLLGFDANFIYYSDIYLGGSSEMKNGLSNIAVPGSEYGDIVSICGAEDFLFISRERRNFVLIGDPSSSSASITECDIPVGGAYNTKAASNAWSGQVVFMNQSGIWSVTSNGTIKDIASDIKGLFFGALPDEVLFDKTVFKTLATTRSTALDGSIFKIFMDEVRGFIIILTAKASSTFVITGSNMLVYNVKEGKWYEFDAAGASSAESKDGAIICLETNRATEDGVMRGTEKQLLVSQWLTVDAPSLEKQILQLKMFGEFTAKTSDGLKGMTVGQQNDWAPFVSIIRTGWNTNETYTPESYETYFHKKRLDSSKPLATSIILESQNTGSFTLEGMEIEGVVVQTGIKK